VTHFFQQMVVNSWVSAQRNRGSKLASFLACFELPLLLVSILL
jgi:hypothetical protein